MENPFEIINHRLERIENLLENINRNISREETKAIIPKVMNIKQLSDYLGVSLSYLYKQTSSHKIPHSKRGKRLYFNIETINDWVLENEIWTQEDIENQVDDYLSKKRKHF